MQGQYENYDKPFPKRLRELLEETGLSQQELADYVGVKRQTIAQWKDGKTVPDIYGFQKIAEFFHLPYEYLFGESNSKIRENLHLEHVLGLSDEAIDVLKRFHAEKIGSKERKVRTPLSQIISLILQDEDFEKSIYHFQDCLRESALKIFQEHDYKYSDELLQLIREAISFLQATGVAVMNPETMKKYHLELAKTAFSKALEKIEVRMLAERMRTLLTFMEEYVQHEDFDDILHEYIQKELGHGHSDKAG